MIIKKGSQSSTNPAAQAAPSRGFDSPNTQDPVTTVQEGSGGAGVVDFSPSSSKGRYFNPMTGDVVDIIGMEIGGSVDQYGNTIPTTFTAKNGRRYTLKEFDGYIKVEDDFTFSGGANDQLSPDEMDVVSLEELEDILNDEPQPQQQQYTPPTREIPSVQPQINPTNTVTTTPTVLVETVQKPVEDVTSTWTKTEPHHQPNKCDELKQYIVDLEKFKNLLSTSTLAKKKPAKKKKGEEDDNSFEEEAENPCNAMLEAIINDFADKLITNENGVITIIDIRDERYSPLVDQYAVKLHPDFNQKNILAALKKHVSKIF